MAVKRFRTLDEIEADRNERERKEFKEKVSGDLRGIFDDFFKPEKKPVKKKSKFWNFIKWLGLLFLLLLIINFILGNVWLFKFLIKSLFLGG